MTAEGREWRGRRVRLTALQRLSFLASRVAYHRADRHELENSDPRRIGCDAGEGLTQAKEVKPRPRLKPDYHATRRELRVHVGATATRRTATARAGDA